MAQPRSPRAIERAWAVSVALALALFSLVLFFSILVGGYGVVLADCEFLLLRGRAQAAIDQGAGLAFFLLTYAFLASFGIAVTLGLAVFVRNGTLKPDEVLAGGTPADTVCLAFLRVAPAFIFLPLLALLLRAFS